MKISHTNEDVTNDKIRHDLGGRTIKDFWIAVTLSLYVLGALFIIGTILLAVALHDGSDFNTVPERVVHEIEENTSWDVPDNIDDDGRIFLTMTGGGGGGCNGGSTIAGGGGNSGVSVVNYPIILKDGFKCKIMVGYGGDLNHDGSKSEINCFDDNGVLVFYIKAEGGRSGCELNHEYNRRGTSNIYPNTKELFGARPINSTFAESHPYGGIGGPGLSGGAGSVFGHGADAMTEDFHRPAHGAGGYGGSSNFGHPGKGGNGKIVFVYHTK